MAYKYKVLLRIAPAVFFLDLLTKWLVVKHMGIGEQIAILPNFFDLVHIRNTGAAFGMLASVSENVRVPFFYAISIFAVGVLIYCFRNLETSDRFYPIPLSLVSGGVLGNLSDRLRFGNVVDFLSFHVGDKIISGVELRWPAFNVADSAITVAIILLIAHTFKKQ